MCSSDLPANTRSAIWKGIFVSLVIATIASMVITLTVIYSKGLGVLARPWGKNGWSFTGAEMKALFPRPDQATGDMGILYKGTIGIVAYSVLNIIRSRFVWWPIHPVGLIVGLQYASGGGGAVGLALIVRFMAQRWMGGSKANEFCRQLALGLIVGGASVKLVSDLLRYFLLK